MSAAATTTTTEGAAVVMDASLARRTARCGTTPFSPTAYRGSCPRRRPRSRPSRRRRRVAAARPGADRLSGPPPRAQHAANAVRCRFVATRSAGRGARRWTWYGHNCRRSATATALQKPPAALATVLRRKQSRHGRDSAAPSSGACSPPRPVPRMSAGAALATGSYGAPCVRRSATGSTTRPPCVRHRARRGAHHAVERTSLVLVEGRGKLHTLLL